MDRQSMAVLDNKYNSLEFKNLKIKKNTVEHDIRSKKILNLYLEHKTYNQIAKELGISLSIVSTTVKQALSDWNALELSKVREMAYKQLLKIDKIEAEMWEAWNLSKLKPKKTTLHSMSGAVTKDAKGNIVDDSIKPTRQRKEITEEERFSGDLDFMSIIQWCDKARREWLKLYLPNGKVVGTDDNINGLSKNDMAREEILKSMRDILDKKKGIINNSVEGEIVEDDVPEDYKVITSVQKLLTANTQEEK